MSAKGEPKNGCKQTEQIRNTVGSSDARVLLLGQANTAGCPTEIIHIWDQLKLFDWVWVI